jgi:hypothetical protein
MTYVRQVPAWRDKTKVIDIQITLRLRAYELPKDVSIEALANGIAERLGGYDDHRGHIAIETLQRLMPDADYVAEGIIRKLVNEKPYCKTPRYIFEQTPDGGGCTSSIDYARRIAEMRIKNSPVLMNTSLESVKVVTPSIDL